MLKLDGMNLMCDETLIATVPMATISILETALKGQEETAILLEEQARRIATLQESLKQVGRIHPNERVILQEVEKVVNERNELRRRLENAELLIEKLKEEVGHWEEDFAMFDRAHEKAIGLWRKEHPDAGYTPDMSDLNEWMVGRVEKAEAVKELLRSALRGINEIAEVWNMYEFKQIRDIAKSALRTAEDSSVVGLIDSAPAKQPEGMTKLDKALQNIDVAKRIITENSCPSEFGLKDCECDDSCCEDCWNEEVGS